VRTPPPAPRSAVRRRRAVLLLERQVTFSVTVAELDP
jgi:hypothetical protein